ncbi:hypothetical protein CMO90_01610 [Candidatus Woesearchaeota archaeon]|jgi:2,3-bisphosphoglycerate-dependent phosphoglycerate mutase|nr:hypothetical protein [Candidatus Woesearchaeota archaeon]|tara:strand:- start:9 stop:656 length:648 start_codon:yes stop_codon:yes gene_type:complete
MKNCGFQKIVVEKKSLENKREKRTNCKIYLFRHAQTYFNKKKIFTGWKDSKLTPFGIKQAEIIAKKLSDKKIDVGFETSLSRSKDTLKKVIKNHSECFMIIEDNRMIERSYGDLQGLTHKAFIAKNGEELYDKYHRAYDFPPPNGESLKMVEERVLSFIKDLLKFIKVNKINVGISAHGNSMRPFRRYFEKFSKEKMTLIENPWDDYFEYEVKCT